MTEWEEQQFDEQTKKVQQWQQKKIAQAGQQLQDKLTREGLQEVAKEMGVEPQELLSMANQNPEMAQNLFKEGVKGFYRWVHQRARDARGRFVSTAHVQGQPQGPALQPQGPAPQPQQQGQRTFTTASPSQRQANLHAAAEKSQGTDDDLEAMLGALLPSDDPFMAY